MKYINTFFTLSILATLYSCNSLIKDPTEGTSTDPATIAPPTLIPLPVPDAYTYVPSTNNYFFRNTAGGGFKISQVFSYPQNSQTFAGVTSDDEYIYTLVKNSKAFAGSYLINKFKLDGSVYQTCTWYGDGNSYSGLAVENSILYLKRNTYNIQIAKYDFANCTYLGLISVSTGTDSDGYSFSGYDSKFAVDSGLFYFTYINSSKSRIKSYLQSNFTLQNYAESQLIGQEPLNYDYPYIVANNSIWTVRPCYASYASLCFWKTNKNDNSLTYSYLPSDYYPELTSSAAGSAVLIRGRTNREVIYALVNNEEIHFYIIDVSIF